MKHVGCHAAPVLAIVEHWEAVEDDVADEEAQHHVRALGAAVEVVRQIPEPALEPRAQRCNGDYAAVDEAADGRRLINLQSVKQLSV